MRNSFVKILAILVIFSLNWNGLLAVGQTISYYLDNEGDGGNSFTAATLDFSLAAGSWSGDPSEMKTGDSVQKQITVNNSGSLGFQYIVEAEKTSGDDDFCNALDVVVKRNSFELYSGSLLGLTINPPVVYESSLIDVWDFDVSLASGSFPIESCGFKFVFTGWQTDLPDALNGFSDVEEDDNTFIGAQGQACDPQNVTLPTDFDIENWRNHAKEGGRVEGSFVFPNSTTGLELGPTEIMGNLIFGNNNTATIKGPIYVHGNLTINPGTRITQDTSFGDSFAAIIVDGTITIGDDVEFLGSGTIGAFLLVSTKTTGTVIDILDGTALNGNLGDAVLFATLGNVHIGDNRTVLDAFITSAGGSGDTGFIAANQTISNNSVDDADNAFVSDDNRAIFNSGIGPDTAEYGFPDLGISGDATITGIEVIVEGQSTGARNLDVALWNISNNSPDAYSSSVQVADFTNGSGTDQTLTLNSPALWSETWTVADFADATFKARVRATIDYAVSIAYLDQLQIKVYYTSPGQIIDNEGTILDSELPDEVVCGPQFMDLNEVVINEFVPNVPDAGIGGNSGFEVPTSIHLPNDWDTRTVGNIQTSNDSYVNDNDEDQQGYSSFGFGIPTGAIINGLEVQIETRSSDPSGCQVGVNLSWNNGSSYATQKNQNLSGSDTIYTLGSSSDLWGHSWLITEFSDANFVMRLEDIDPGGDCSGTTYVDQAQVKVYYTIPAGSYNTGIISPSANTVGTGDGWVNPSNAYADGGSTAYDNEGERHQYYNFGFSISTMATINGIELLADAWSTVGSTAFFTDGFGTTASEDIPNWNETDGNNTEVRAADSGNDSASPNGGAFAVIDNNEWMCRTIDATGYNSVQLSYYWRGDSDANQDNDDLIVEIKSSSGNSCSDSSGWTQLQNHDLRTDSSWSIQSAFGNAGMNNTSFLLRFRTISEDAEYGRIDGVSISGTPTSLSCQLGVDLSWNGGSNWTSPEKVQTLTGTETTYTFGTASDVWGHSWTASEINSNFRARVHSCSGGPTTNLDWLRAKVYYTVAGSENEWVELYNGTGSTVDVNGWALYDSENTHELLITSANTNTGGTTIPAGGYLVVYRDGDADFDLDNTTDTVRLFNDQITTGGTQVDFHNYNYPSGAPENKSFARIPDGTANWVDPEPTPGEPNNMFVVPYVEEENIEEPIEEALIEEEVILEEYQEEGIIDGVVNEIEEIVNEIIEEILPETEITEEEPVIEEIIPEPEAIEEQPIIEENNEPVIEPVENSPADETEITLAPENDSTDNSEGDVPENNSEAESGDSIDSAASETLTSSETEVILEENVSQ